MGLLIALQPSIGPALVVGGGSVAARKVTSLLDAGFAVTVVAPHIEERVASSGATLVNRAYEPADIEGNGIVFACTNNREVNRDIGERCRQAGVPVLVADSQAESTFFSLATLRQGDVQVGVSTGGSGPGLAATIRDTIAAALPRDLADQADEARKKRRQSP